jgi:inner membrane protein
MDNVTHTLFALTLARTRLGRAGRGTTTALVLASNAPDIDIVTTAGGALNYLHWHRGPTHGPLGIIGLGLVTAGLVVGGRRIFDKRRTEPGATFFQLAGVSIIGVLLHVLMDLPTSYGTRSLSPFGWRWYAEDWMPIIDIYLLTALGAGLLFGRGSEQIRRQNVSIVFSLMLVIYGVRGIAHHEAVALAPRLFGPTLPAPCAGAPSRSAPLDTWPHEAVALPAEHRCLVDIAATPNLIFPFRWLVIAQTSNSYETFDVNLLDSRYRQTPPDGEALWRHAFHYPNPWTPAAFAAAQAPEARLFLGFSRFPLVRSFVDPAGGTTVHWTDMRFASVGGASGPGRGGAAGRGRGPLGPGGTGNVVSAGDFFAVSVHVSPEGRVMDEVFGR